ncbi:MAG: PilZ domain-containing protein [Treponema sp.]|jgi:hypothetical protein|nr:PilZ domain-containing protein [Treponema sp.]
MGIMTSQRISAYYERYKTINVTYSKEIMQVTGLLTQQVFLKSGHDFWPCVIYSSSFEGAKVASNIQTGIIEKLQKANNSVSLRFCFKKPEVETPVAFSVAARANGYSPYSGSKDIALFNLVFTQRPPDDLIEIMGKLLDANVASAKRKDERILLTAEVIRKMNLCAKETSVFIQGVPRRCILRDISFSGAKLIMMGVAKFLVNREAGLRVDFDDPRESFMLRGSFIRSEAVEGRKELIALAAEFTEVPMGYKIRLNDYLGSVLVRQERQQIPAEAKEKEPSPADEKEPAQAPPGEKEEAKIPPVQAT